MFATSAIFRHPQFLSSAAVVCAAFLALDWTLAGEGSGTYEAEQPWRSLSVASTPVSISREGRLEFRLDATTVAFDVASRLDNATPGKLESVDIESNTACFRRRWQSSDCRASCSVEDCLQACGDVLKWKVTVSGIEGLWSAPVITEIRVPKQQYPRYWTTWGSGDPTANVRSPWSDPLVPADLADRRMFFGGRTHEDVSAISIPVVAFMDSSGNSAIGFAHAPGDPLVELELQTTAEGAARFVRTNRRITPGNSFSYTVLLYPRLAGCRDLLRLFRDGYPQFFEPRGAMTWLVAGNGAYSEWEGPLQDYLLHRQGFGFNWKAGYDYVYMGMYLPLTDDENLTWTNARAFGAQGPRVATSIRNLREYSARMRKSGFHVLNYMNPAEFGLNVVRSGPAPPRKAAADADLWKDPNDFVHYRIRDALLYPKDGGEPWGAWENGVLADLGIKSFQDFLVDQVRRHLEKLPESSGFCFDRTDFLRFYNWQRDDGIAWASGGKCGSLALSWLDLMRRVGPMVHDRGKVIFCNPLYRRFDLYENIDGFYDEIGTAPSSLNQCALMALCKPYVAWTQWFPRPNRHEYFQRHLYLGSFLTVPMPLNNHTLNPGDDELERLYAEYGLLFESLRGRRWLLEDNAVRVSAGRTNAFEIPGGVLIAIALAGDADKTDLEIRSRHPVFAEEHFFEVLRPGDSEWQSLSPLQNRHAAVPLRHGCALVRAVHTKILPSGSGLLKAAPIEVATKVPNANFMIETFADGQWNSPQSYRPAQMIESSVPYRITIRDGLGKPVPNGTFERQWTVCPIPAPTIAPARAYVRPGRREAIRIYAPVDAEGSEIRFTTDGSEPTRQSTRYTEAIALTDPMTLKAKLFCGEECGNTVCAEYRAMPKSPPVPDVCLADLKPLKATVGVPGTTIGVNRSWSGTPLSIAGNGYTSGIGTCARSDLVYRVEPGYRRFVAVVGVDDAMRDYPQASIIFRVFSDARDGEQAAEAIAGETLLTETGVMRSGEIDFIDVPVPDNAKTIRLEADEAGDGIDCDHADWASAGFVTQPHPTEKLKE
jgi:hypothetical protein